MDPASLTIGVVALLGSCCKLLEHYNNFRDYGSDVYIAQKKGKAFKVQLQKWGRDVGFVNHEMVEPHSSFLDCPADVRQIEDILAVIESSLKKAAKVHDRSLESKRQRITAKFKWMGEEKAFTGRHFDIVETFIDILESAYPAKRVSEMGKSLDELAEQKHLEIRHRNKSLVKEWLDIRHFVQDPGQFADQRTEGTCEWLSEHEAYQAWRDQPSPRAVAAKMLWICGPPGYGKSVLMGKVLEDIAKDRDYPIAYCFSRPHIDAGGKLADVARLWIAQLLERGRDARAMDMATNTMESSKNALATSKEVWQLLRDVCSEAAPCLVALDGLDEYGFREDDVVEFISLVVDTLADIDLRILVSSRPEGDIRTKFAEIESQQHQLLVYRCSLTKELTQADIEKCVKEVISNRLAKKSVKLQSKVMKEMVERSEGMFLWVRLQQNYLLPSKTEWELLNILRAMPRGLYNTYEDYWKRILRGHECDKRKAIALLTLICYAVRSLTVAELAEAICMSWTVTAMEHEEDLPQGDLLCPENLPEIIDEYYVDTEIRGLCGAAIELRPGKQESIACQTVHFLHASAKRFIEEKLSTSQFDKDDSGETMACDHTLLARCCLNYMQQAFAWTREGENWSSESWISKPAFLEYAVRSWHLHVRAAGEDSNTIKLANDFVQTKNEGFQRWVEHDFSAQVDKYPVDVRHGISKGTPLYYACRLSLPTVARSINEAAPDLVNVTGGEFGTALEAACANGDLKMVQMLCDWGASLDIVSGEFGTPMNAAVSQGHEDCVRHLVKCAQSESVKNEDGPGKQPGPHTKEEDSLATRIINASAPTYFIRNAALVHFSEQRMRDFTPLHCAAWHGRVEIAKLLVKLGAEIDARDSVKATPLILASERGHLELVTLFIGAGADINAQTKDNQEVNDELTALSVASRYGKLDVVKRLLEAGADVTTATHHGWRPLDYAAFRNQAEVSKLLIDHGAPINNREDGSSSPLWHSAYSGSVQAAQVLIDHGARSSNDAYSAIHCAAKAGRVELVQLLLQRGLSIDSKRSNNGWQPIHEAVDAGNLDMVECLIKHGASLDSKTQDGETALYLAVNKSHYKIASYLLRSGARPNACNNSQCTPLHLAYSMGNIQILQLLLSSKADTQIRTSKDWCLPASLRTEVKTIEDCPAFFGSETATASSLTAPITKATSLMVQVIVPKLTKCSTQHRTRILQWLEDSDIDFHAVDAYGTPLYQRLSRTDERILNLLVRNNVDLIYLFRDYSTLMIQAARDDTLQLAKVEQIFKNMMETSRHSKIMPAKDGDTLIEPRLFLPGAWKGFYAGLDEDNKQYVDFTVDSFNEHELSLSSPGTPFIAASAKDNWFKFKLFGCVLVGDGCFWWNKIHRDGSTWVWNGTLTERSVDPAANTEVSGSTADRSVSMHDRQIVIEGKWGRDWDRWMGTFKLERTFNRTET